MRYARVNHDGVLRILDKLTAKYSPEDVSALDLSSRLADIASRSSRGPWLPLLNATLQQVGEALTDCNTENNTRSLLLEHHGISCFPSSVIASIGRDDAQGLLDFLLCQCPESFSFPEAALARLVQVTTIHEALRCQAVLLANLRSKTDKDTTPTNHDYIHKIVQHLGRSTSPRDGSSAAKSIRQVLKALHPSQLNLLQSPDILGRLPLHYAAIHGLDGVCSEIASFIHDTGQTHPLGDVRISTDVFRLTPMDYAIRKGHAAVVDVLIPLYEKLAKSSRSEAVEKLDSLATSIAAGSCSIANHLIREGWGTRFITRSGETTLHLAAKHGMSELIKPLIAAGVDVDAQEQVRDRTALATASALGNIDVVKILMANGADPKIPDVRGWLAKDHAAYRGHLKAAGAIDQEGSWELQHKQGKRLGAANILPVRSAEESVIFIHFGSLNLFKKTVAVDMTPYRKHVFPVQVPDTSFDLSMSLAGNQSPQKHIFSLPHLADNSDRPICFTTEDPDNTTLVFKVRDLLQGEVVGTGIALLSNLTGTLGGTRDNLIRAYSIPLVSDQLGHVGTVVFTLVVARPYSGAWPAPQEQQVQRLYREPEPTLGGHRGNGMNDNSGCLQLYENTIQSFLTAMRLGADIIELDVQLTKDDVPVVYHDFLVIEMAAPAPMHTLTYEQFMTISDTKLAKRLPSDEKRRPRAGSKRRRSSVCLALDNTAKVQADPRHYSINEPFITLLELYSGLPEDIPLDIELKYPLLYEAAEFKMDNFAPEINRFLDNILSVTFEAAGRRRIIFTSFNPDICMVMAVKQQKYPVLFLNDSSNAPTGDMRATCLQTAVRLTHRLGMAGLGMAGEPFAYSPGTIGLVKQQGLYTSSYGPANDDMRNVEIQAKAGIDLIIVNKVKLSRQVMERAKVDGEASK